MQFEVEHSPTFSVLTVSLQQGESVYAQPHAMVSMTPRVEIRAKLGAQQAKSGWTGAFRNVLTGESLFAAIFTAKDVGQQVVLAPETIGEVFPLPLGDAVPEDGGAAPADGATDNPEGDAKPLRGFYLQRGAYLASSPEVKLAVKYGGMRGVMAAKGLFLMHATGDGTVFCCSHGAVVRRDLAEGERLVVDNKYVVAFSDTVEYQLVKATDSLRDSVFSGEGLVNRYTGPGSVYYQTRGRPSTGGLLSWIFQAAT